MNALDVAVSEGIPLKKGEWLSLTLTLADEFNNQHAPDFTGDVGS